MIVYPYEAKDERIVVYSSHNAPRPGENTRTGVISFPFSGKMAVPLYDTCVLIKLNIPMGSSSSCSKNAEAFGGSHGAGSNESLSSMGYQSWSINARACGVGAQGSSLP